MICFDCEELIEHGDINMVDEGEYSQVAVCTKCWEKRNAKAVEIQKADILSNAGVIKLKI